MNRLATVTALRPFADLQDEARERAAGFLETAACAATPREAADWSLAAKNTIAVALTCEQIAKTREAGRK